jgi:PST family polysaccharide transporter
MESSPFHNSGQDDDASHLHELSGRAVGGIFWTALSNLVSIVLFMGTLVVLSRQVAPSEIGIMTMAEMLYLSMKVLNYLGFEQALIQRGTLTGDDCGGSFIVSIVIGFILSLLLYIISPLIALFFHENGVTVPIRIAALAVFFGGFSCVPRAVLLRDLRFRLLVTVEMMSLLLWSVISIVFVLSGFGVKGVMIGWAVQRLAESIFLYRLSRWRFTWPASFGGIREMLPFCLQLSGQNIVNFLTAHIDYLLIGKLLNVTKLGYYTMAYRMVSLPHARISPIVTRVTYPLFCALQEKDENLRKGYLLTLSLISTLAFPMVTGLAVLAPEVVKLMYGQKWLPAVPPLRLLAMVGILKAVGSAAGSIILSKGRAEIGLKINLSVLLCLGVGLTLSSRWEVNGIAACYSVVLLGIFPVVQRVLGKLIQLGLDRILRSMIPAALGSAVMGTSLALFGFIIGRSGLAGGDLLYLVLAISLGTAIYMGFLRICYREHFRRTTDLVREMFSRLTS